MSGVKKKKKKSWARPCWMERTIDVIDLTRNRLSHCPTLKSRTKIIFCSFHTGIYRYKYTQLATYLLVLDFYHIWLVNVYFDWQVASGQLTLIICSLSWKKVNRKISRVVWCPLSAISFERPEPRHDKTNKVIVRSAKTQISLGIADQSLRWAHTHFVGFVMSWLTCFFNSSAKIALLVGTSCAS